MNNSGKSSVLQSEFEIALIGMAGRFPGAGSVEKFWHNLRDGVESITLFSDEELKSNGIDPALLSDPNYVKSGAILDGVDLFDASFFGFSPREAEMMDPQHRLFLECSWEALENAGYDPERYRGLIGVYAGAAVNSYMSNHMDPNLRGTAHGYQIELGNDKDYLPTRVSYKLNLKGPSVNIQTACSTSLVAVHLACQALVSGESDIALAGGVSIYNPQTSGYLYQKGMILSPDGHCRAFDAKAQGTFGGNGLGIVVLKRLADAMADGDSIYAVIKGSAINNDGSLKVGYTAPSVEGQARVIEAAQVMAGIDPETISYIEAHGTGTELGDPIEIEALTTAFRATTKKEGFCAIGSLKTNVGHLNTAAGVAGLIKTVLALHHKMLLPSLHFQRPNPEIDFQKSPFYVNTKLSHWMTGATPRRAGVSSFGIGGTNAHLVLEEAPASEASPDARRWQLLVVSAKTATALDSATARLAEHLKQHPTLNLADAAYTLQVGRAAFSHRRMLVCRDVEDAVTALETLPAARVMTRSREFSNPPVVFMFPGQGAQYVNMGRELYQTEPVFRHHVDRCSELLRADLGIDLRAVLYPGDKEAEAATERLKQTLITQPALFVIEYALAQLWMTWGIRPAAMIGHSIGEYVAACLAGVFSVEDALKLVAARGRLMQQLPAGAMLAVPLAAEEVECLLSKELSLAAINEPSLSIVSGPNEAIGRLEAHLAERVLSSRRLHTSHAFHSVMMDPILESFTKEVRKLKLSPPKIPYVSNVTGTWITAEEATEPNYWARHLRQTVLFAAGVRELLREPRRVLLEVGPGRTLATLAGRQEGSGAQHFIACSMRHPDDNQSDVAFLLSALGRLWLCGVNVDWSSFYSSERRYRVPLPTYPFERQRYWVEPREQASGNRNRPESLDKRPDIADWFYIPSWKRSTLLESADLIALGAERLFWLVFVDEGGLGSQLVRRLEQYGQDVISVKAGASFSRICENLYNVNPQVGNDYRDLVKALCEKNRTPNRIVHLWNVTSDDHLPTGIESFERSQSLGFYSLLYLAQALGEHCVTEPLRIDVISNHTDEVEDEVGLRPDKATMLGPCKVIPQEYRNFVCRSIDIVFPSVTMGVDALVAQLLKELVSHPTDSVVAYRGKQRWLQTFEPVRLAGARGIPRLKTGGVYLITGGLGRIGLVLAEYLAKAVKAKLVLTGRFALPAKEEWDQWLRTHDDQDEVVGKIRRIRALEELGAEVLTASADVADLGQMRNVIAQAISRFRALDGVIHAAGIVGEKSRALIDETDLDHCQSQFRAKAYGLLVLDDLLRDRQLDFCLLISSLSSVLGGLGFSAYAAANLFMDAFAHHSAQVSGLPWLSVNYDGWKFTEESDQEAKFGRALARLAMTPEESVEVFRRLLSINPAPQVIVSTGDLTTRINQWIKLESSQHADQPRHVESAISPVLSSLHSRPNLPNPYVAPKNELQQTIASIWQKLLGIEQVGIFDNFLTLGGHSLLATQVISRIHDALKVNVSLRSLFEATTVAELAERVETVRWAAQGRQTPPVVAVVEREEIKL